MGMVGGVVGAAPGIEPDMILDVQASVIGGSLKVLLNPVGEFSDRYWAPWISGAYVGQNVFTPAGSEPSTFCFPLGPDAEVASIFFNDAGDWPDYSDPVAFPDGIPPGGPLSYESVDANRILFSWQPNYVLTEVIGDTQLSSLVITNPARGVNLAPGSLPTRGDLSYSITTVSGIHTISWYAGSRIVAQGTIAGDGAFSCSQMTGSMLQATGVLTYSGDIPAGTATLEVCWPAQYYVYFSTSPIVIPSSPQYVVNDQNAIRYLYLSPTLGGSSYYYTVLTVDDQGNVQTTGYPTPDPLVINNAPPPVSNLYASGDAAALTINWTPGEPNDEFMVYYSFINQPVNLGDYALPAPIWRDFNSTSATLPPITGYAPVDRSGYVSTMQGAMNVAVAAILAQYSAGETGFAATVTAQQAAMQAAAIAYGQAIGVNVYKLLEALAGQVSTLLGTETYLATLNLTTANWQAQMYTPLASFISYCGSAVFGNYLSYTMPDGLTGPQNSGYQGENFTGMCSPVILPGTLRVIVRAQNLEGVQENNDQQLDVTFDATGNIVGTPPNNARITGIVPMGLDAQVNFEVNNDNAEAIADTIYVYAGTKGSSINIDDPQVTVALGLPSGFNLQSGSGSWLAPGAGTYQFAVAAVAAGVIGTLSPLSYIYLGTSQQIAVSDLVATVQRGQ